MSEKTQQPEMPGAEGNGDAAPADPGTAFEQAEARAEEYRDQYLRAAAELENVRKRAQRDVEKARRFGTERFAADLLDVLDSLEMGVQAGAEASAESLLEGTRATLKLLEGAMAKAGVAVIDPEGETFDPQFHEAMTMQASDSAEPGSVLTVVQKGYQLNGRLLRPARVIVATEAAGGEKPAEGA